MADDIVKQTYDQFSTKINLGDEKAFRNALKKKETARQIYDQATNAGFNTGDYETFERAMGVAQGSGTEKVQQPKAPQTVPMEVQTQQQQDAPKNNGQQNRPKAIAYAEKPKVRAEGESQWRTPTDNGSDVYWSKENNMSFTKKEKGGFTYLYYADGSVDKYYTAGGEHRRVSHTASNGDVIQYDKNGKVSNRIEAFHAPRITGDTGIHEQWTSDPSSAYPGAGALKRYADSHLSSLPSVDNIYSGMSSSQLRSTLNQLEKEASSLTPGSEEYAKKANMWRMASLELNAKDSGFSSHAEAKRNPGQYAYKRYRHYLASAYNCDLSGSLLDGSIVNNPNVMTPSIVLENRFEIIATMRGNDQYNNKAKDGAYYENRVFDDKNATGNFLCLCLGKALKTNRDPDDIVNEEISKISYMMRGTTEEQVTARAREFMDNASEALKVATDIADRSILCSAVEYLVLNEDERHRLGLSLGEYRKSLSGTQEFLHGMGALGVDTPLYMLGGASSTAMIGRGGMQLAAGRVLHSGLTMAQIGLVGQAVNDLKAGQFSGPDQWFLNTGVSFISGLSLGVAGEGARFVALRPTNFAKVAWNKGTSYGFETAGFTLPEWVQTCYQGYYVDEKGEKKPISGDYFYKTALHNTGVVVGLKGFNNFKGWKPPVTKTQLSSLNAYPELRQALEYNLDCMNKGVSPEPLSGKAKEQMDRLQSDMNTQSKGVSWSTYRNAMLLCGYNVTPPAPSAVRQDGRKVQLLDANGRVITENICTNSKKAASEAAKLQKTIEHEAEERNIIRYVAARDSHIDYEACAELADRRTGNVEWRKRNEDGTFAVDENGNYIADENYHCTTPDDIYEQVRSAQAVPEEARTPEQRQLLDEFAQSRGELESLIPDADQLAQQVCDSYGITFERLAEEAAKSPKERDKNSTAAKAMATYDELLTRGMMMHNKPVGEVMVDGQWIQVYNEPNRDDKNGVYFYKDENGKTQMLGAKSVTEYRSIANERAQRYEASDDNYRNDFDAAVKTYREVFETYDDNYLKEQIDQKLYKNGYARDEQGELVSWDELHQRLSSRKAEIEAEASENALSNEVREEYSRCVKKLSEMDACSQKAGEPNAAVDKGELVGVGIMLDIEAERAENKRLAEDAASSESTAVDIDRVIGDKITSEGLEGEAASARRQELETYYKEHPLELKKDMEALADRQEEAPTLESKTREREELETLISKLQEETAATPNKNTEERIKALQEELSLLNEDIAKMESQESESAVKQVSETFAEGSKELEPDATDPLAADVEEPVETEVEEVENPEAVQPVETAPVQRAKAEAFVDAYFPGLKGDAREARIQETLGSDFEQRVEFDKQDGVNKDRTDAYDAAVAELEKPKTETVEKMEETPAEDVAKPSQPTETPQPENAMQPAEVPEAKADAPKAEETETPEAARDRKINELLDFMGLEGKDREYVRDAYLAEPERLEEEYSELQSELQKAEETPKEDTEKKSEEKPEEKKDEEPVAEEEEKEDDNVIVDDPDTPMPTKEVKGRKVPDYSKSTPSRTRKFIYEDLGYDKETADGVVNDAISAAKDALKKHKKTEPKRPKPDEVFEYAEKKAAWDAKQSELEGEQAYWEEVAKQQKTYDVLNEIREAKTPQSMSDLVNKLRQRYGGSERDGELYDAVTNYEPKNLYEACMQFLASGARFVWDAEGAKKGLKQQTGWGDGERRKMIGMIAKEENGGITPEAAVHRIVDLYGEDLGIGLDQSDVVLNTLLEALQGVKTKGDASAFINARKLAKVEDILLKRINGEGREDLEADRRADEEFEALKEQYKDELPENPTVDDVANLMERKRQENEEVDVEGEQQGEETLPNETSGEFEAPSDEVPFSLKQEQTDTNETVAKDVRERLEEKVGKDLADRIENIANSLGVKVRFTDEDVNGFMDYDEGVLYIGKNLDSDKTEAFVAGHEFTHEMQTLSEGKGSDVYDTFKQAALEWAKEHMEEGGKGYDFDWLKKRYENHYVGKYLREAMDRGMGFNEAMKYAERKAKELVTDDYVNDEIAANVAGRMLENPAIAEDMFKLKEAETPQERRTRLQRILDWIKEYISKRIGNKTPEELTPEEQKLLDLRDKFNDMYNEVVREDLDAQGIETSENGDARDYSVRFLTDEAQREDIIKGLMEHTERSREDVEKWLDSESSLASMILGDPERLDYDPDPRHPAIKENSDYKQGTVDFSNICRKRKDFTDIYSTLQRENPNRIFTAEDLEEIRQTMIEDGYTVACGLCFVEDRRQRLGEIGQDFIDFISGKDVKINENQKKAFAKLRESGDEYIPNLYELNTPDGLRKLLQEHPSVYTAFDEFNNARGQQTGRLYQGYNEYKREILDWSDAKVKKANDLGGLRIFSFSDFEAPQLLDIIQIIEDCGARGVKIQGYTKVPEFAKAMKDTGIKLNQSLIPKGDGVKVVDGKEVLDYDPVEGIDVNDKNFVNDPDNPNVGTILVGINDKQIRLAMQDPFVDYIIPFHTGIKKDVLIKKGIDGWTNYKLFQRDKDISTGKGAKKEINIYTDVLQAAEAEGKPITNKVEFVNKFLEVAKERGLEPRFSQFLEKDADGNYVYTEGYHKFLIDFKLFDKEGNIIPQEVVKPIFDDAFNKEILDKYAEDSKVDADYSDVLGKIRGRLGIEERRKTRYEEMAENTVEDSKASQEEIEERNIRFSLVEDPEEIERLDKEPKEVGYRNVVLNEDGSLGSPMANRLGKTGVGRRATTPFEFNRWERSDENPDLANDKGKIDLIKPDGKPVGGVDYNPYIHIRPTTVNKQFKQAWERDNLVYIKTEYPASELNGEYQAEKAAKPVGKHPWGGGELILSRWDKPVEIVPWEEVANEWVKEFEDRGVEFDIVPPKLLPILMERGVEILPPHKGMGKACNDAYREKVLNKGEAQYSLKEDTAKREELRDSEESKKLFDATKKKFGTTNDFREAGYILPDGTMLDFSGRHWMNKGDDSSHLAGNRAVDHRAIHEVGWDDNEGPTGFKTSMTDFIERGAIRINGPYGINLSVPPTREQAAVLRRYMQGKKVVSIDFGNGDNTEHAVWYGDDSHPNAPYPNASRILADIDRYFYEGIKPKGDPVPYYSLREEGSGSDLASRMRERWRERMARAREAEGQPATEVRQENAEPQTEARTENGGGGENIPPTEPPAPQPQPAPRAELPPTEFDRPATAIEKALGSAMKVITDTSTSMEDRNAARKELSGTLRDLTKAMRIQKDYDKATVENVVAFAREMVNSGLIDHEELSRMNELFTAIKRGTGKTPKGLETVVNRMVDIMLKSQERQAQNEISQLLNTKAVKTENGIQKQGAVDLRGQHMLEEMNDWMGRSSTDIGARLADIRDKKNEIGGRLTDEEKLNNADYRDWDDKETGAMLAQRYQDNVESHAENIRQINEDLEVLKARHKNGEISGKAYTEAKRDLENDLREERIKLIESKWDAAADMNTMITEGRSRAKDFIEAQKAHKDEVLHNGFSDMQRYNKETGEWEATSAASQREKSFKDKLSNISGSTLGQSLSTLNSLLKQLGKNAANGMGYLYKRFAYGWVDCAEKEWNEWTDDCAKLDAKAVELFGENGIKRFTDIHELVSLLPKMEVSFRDGDEVFPHTLDQGQLLYIYCVDKMADGRRNLRFMGIDSDKVNEITEFLDPRLKEMADWLQSDFLVEKRKQYNETYRRMYGADMEAIENYFPLMPDKNQVPRETDIGSPDAIALPSSTTGSMMKRNHKAYTLDLMGSNAIDIVIKHLQDTGRWNNFGEWIRDANTLMSSKRFRNQVRNQHTIYGTGDKLLGTLENTFAIAAGAYKPKATEIDKFAVNVGKGVSASKVTFRAFTAMKQLLSLPAFSAQADPSVIMRNMARPKGSWDWCMKNLPLFDKRWQSRKAGDTRLESTELDWNWTRKEWIKEAARYGLKPNAFIDAVTIAIGARSVYDTRYSQYKKLGYKEADAVEKAMKDATIAFNETQQSSEGLFVAPMQVDRSWLAVGLSVFRNASMGYERLAVDGARDFKRSITNGKAMREYMKKMYMREGMTDNMAERAAKLSVQHSQMAGLCKIVTGAFLAPFAWNIGGQLPYLIFGDNGDEKKKRAKDAMWGAAAAGWLEGVAGGNVMSDVIQSIHQGQFRFDDDLMPISSDISRMMEDFFKTDKNGEAHTMRGWVSLANIIFSSAIGVNPQTATDIMVDIFDGINSVTPDKKTGVAPNLGLAKEIALHMMRIMQVPQSQLDQIFIDEINMTAAEAQKLTPKQLASRIAYYKLHKETPMPLAYAYSNDKLLQQVKNKEQQFFTKINEGAEDAASLRVLLDKNKDTDKGKTYLDNWIDALEKEGPTAMLNAREEESAKGNWYLVQRIDKRLNKAEKSAQDEAIDLTSYESKRPGYVARYLDGDQSVLYYDWAKTYEPYSDKKNEVCKKLMALGGERNGKAGHWKYKKNKDKVARGASPKAFNDYYKEHKAEADMCYKLYRIDKEIGDMLSSIDAEKDPQKRDLLISKLMQKILEGRNAGSDKK